MCRVTWSVGKRSFKFGETVALAPIDILHVPGAKIYPSFTKPTRHFSNSACDMYITATWGVRTQGKTARVASLLGTCRLPARDRINRRADVDCAAKLRELL